MLVRNGIIESVYRHTTGTWLRWMEEELSVLDLVQCEEKIFFASEFGRTRIAPA